MYAPTDFRNEENYLKSRAQKAASLTQVLETIYRTAPVPLRAALPQDTHVQPQILWVDDRPENNVYERHAFDVAGIHTVVTRATEEALRILEKEKFQVIISDMARPESHRAGYLLLEALRKRGDRTPFFIYAGSRALEYRDQVVRRGGQGSTSDPQELFQLVTAAIAESQA